MTQVTITEDNTTVVVSTAGVPGPQGPSGGAAAGAVVYNAVQTLTAGEKTQARANIDVDAAGTAATLDAAHAAAADPHTGYLQNLAAGTLDTIATVSADGTVLARAAHTIATLLAAAYARASHTGTQIAATISDFTAAAIAAVTWSTITGKPATFAPSAHAASHTAGGTDAVTVATGNISDDAVTYAKIQNVTTARLLGRATAAAGDAEEITLGTNLSFTGTTLNAAGGGGTPAGAGTEIQYRNAGAFGAMSGTAWADATRAYTQDMLASQVSHPWSIRTNAGVACVSVQSDGGLIIDQRTGATYTSVLDVKYVGTSLFKVQGNGNAEVVAGDLELSSLSKKISFGGGNLYVACSGFGQFVETTTNVIPNTGPATSKTSFTKAVTAIADLTATAVMTLSIPNASHSASVRVKLVGKIGAGGAVGAGEATGTIEYDIAITRTVGANAVAGISAAFGSATAVVAGGATITVTGTLGAVVGAVGAVNTIPINITITKGSGASGNHSCVVYAELINANATGVTIS